MHLTSPVSLFPDALLPIYSLGIVTVIHLWRFHNCSFQSMWTSPRSVRNGACAVRKPARRKERPARSACTRCARAQPCAAARHGACRRPKAGHTIVHCKLHRNNQIFALFQGGLQANREIPQSSPTSTLLLQNPTSAGRGREINLPSTTFGPPDRLRIDRPNMYVLNTWPFKRM